MKERPSLVRRDGITEWAEKDNHILESPHDLGNFIFMGLVTLPLVESVTHWFSALAPVQTFWAVE